MRMLTQYALAMMVCVGCTDTGLYAVSGAGVGGPDKEEIVGEACVPIAAGTSFPVKVIFAVEGGSSLNTDQKQEVIDAINMTADRFSDPYISFDIVAYHTVATAMIGSFVAPGDQKFAQGVTRYNNYQESGPISLRAPLKLADSLLSGDMQTGCRGTTARTRYLVVLLMVSADTSCANPVFNPGIDDACNDFLLLNEYAQCSACELTHRTQDLRALQNQYGAGEVSVQPVYVRDNSVLDGGVDVTAYEAAAIAQAGGTSLVATDPSQLANALNSLDYASLQRSLTLKRLIAFKRNTISRKGQILIDIYVDGIPDVDEPLYGTSPTNPDTDGDNINDGIEVKMGMD